MAESPTDSSGAMYHLGLKKRDVGRVALLPGDPGRVEAISRRFRDAKFVASHREYTSYSGFVGGERVVATSTGIGGPSTAIAIEELARLGVDVMVRVGTCGSISKSAPLGSLVIADAAVRLEGTSGQYVMPGFPAAATPEVVIALKETAVKLHRRASVGTTASTDSFYVGQNRAGFGGYSPSHLASQTKDLQRARVLCYEMESATLFTLGRIFGLSTGAVFSVVADRVGGELRPEAGIEDCIDVAVGSVSLLKKTVLRT